MISISWYKIRNFAAWVEMHQPTEVEWEKVASWDDQQKKKCKYPWEDIFDQIRCNTSESSKIDIIPVDFYAERGAS